MHHLLITIGSHGDTHPFVGLGTRLRNRGHRVTLAANGLFAPLIEKAGLEFVELGTAEEYLQALQEPDLWHPIKGFKTVFETGVLPLMPRTYELIERHAMPGETVLTAHAIAFGARIAHEKLGFPLATIHLAPAVLRSDREPPIFAASGMMRHMPAWVNRLLYRYVFDALAVDPVLARPINAFRAEVGLPASPRAKRIIDQWWNSPQLVVGLFPQWFAPLASDLPPQMRLVGFPLYDERGVEALPARLESFLEAGEPPIAFTFGSAMTHAASELAASAAACRLAGRRGLLLTRHREQVPTDLPNGVIHVDYAPFSELLPCCAALVHHGGIGTTSQALAAGVPQLIVPFAHDQHDNADRVRRLGCGAEMRPRHYRAAAKVAAVLGKLLGDAKVPARCREVAAWFKGRDPLGEACDLIEELGDRSPADHCGSTRRIHSASSLPT
jgi:UDP:flavonoid glycosyltransferase YjiC (YdhE family)